MPLEGRREGGKEIEGKMRRKRNKDRGVGGERKEGERGKKRERKRKQREERKRERGRLEMRRKR